MLQAILRNDTYEVSLTRLLNSYLGPLDLEDYGEY